MRYALDVTVFSLLFYSWRSEGELENREREKKLVSVEEGGEVAEYQLRITPSISLERSRESADAAASRGKGNDLCTPFLMETSDCIQLLSLYVSTARNTILIKNG